MKRTTHINSLYFVYQLRMFNLKILIQFFSAVIVTVHLYNCLVWFGYYISNRVLEWTHWTPENCSQLSPFIIFCRQGKEQENNSSLTPLCPGDGLFELQLSWKALDSCELKNKGGKATLWVEQLHKQLINASHINVYYIMCILLSSKDIVSLVIFYFQYFSISVQLNTEKCVG